MFLPDIFRGTSLYHIQCRVQEFLWTGMFSYVHKWEFHTLSCSFPNCPEIWKSILCLWDSRDDRSVEFFCWHHYERSNHSPQDQSHLKFVQWLSMRINFTHTLYKQRKGIHANIIFVYPIDFACIFAGLEGLQHEPALLPFLPQFHILFVFPCDIPVE